MSTFGDIVEPVSRTAWEDWDDEIVNNNVTILKWGEPLDIVEKVDVLFILEGKFLLECVKQQSPKYLQCVNSVSDINLYIFKIKSLNNYVCTINDYNLLQSSEIIELLKPLLCKSEDVITIQTKPLADYKTLTETHSPCLIKTITTSTPLMKTLDFNFDKLEQPNILSGVGAGVICLREHWTAAAAAIACFIEHTAEYQTDEIQKLLQKFQIIENCITNVSSILNSNLYI